MPFSNIKLDCKRFYDKIEQSVREDLDAHLLSASYKSYKKDGEVFVRLRLPHFSIPRFEKNNYPPVEVWAGEGDIDDNLGYTQPDFWSGDIDDPFKYRWHKKKWNLQRSIKGHKTELEVSFPFKRLRDLMVERLQLNSLLPKLSARSRSEKNVSSSAHRAHFNRNPRRSLRQALKRNCSLGYQPGSGIIMEERDVWSYSSRMKPTPDSNAVIIYVLGDAPKFIARTEVFWLNHLLERQYQEALGDNYKGIKKRYLRYSTFSAEVSLDDFLKMDFAGSPADHVGYSKALEMIDEEQRQGINNIYLFHYSRGNIDRDEKSLIVPWIQEIIRTVNVFGYTQVDTRDRTAHCGAHGGLKGFLEERFVHDVGMGNIMLSYIQNEKRENLGEEIVESLKSKLVTGR